MTDNKRELFSEQRKDMTPAQQAELQEKVSRMTEEELKEFRNSFDPDSMGFCREEGVEYDSAKD